MIRIGFIQAQGQDTRSYGYPLSFGYMASVLREALGRRFEFRIVSEPHELIAFAPELIALGSVSSCFWQAEDYIQLFGDRLPEARIVLGGHHISALPHRLPAGADVGVIGEGEDTFLELVSSFEAGGGWTAQQLGDVAGICYHDRGRVVRTARRPLRDDLDSLPFPLRRKNAFCPEEAIIFTSRGCPFHCAFCSTQQHWERYRRFSADYVVRELEHIALTQPEVRTVYILDDLYVADRRRLRRMVRLVDEAGLNRRFDFHGFVRSNLVDDELCELLRAMNVRAIRFGAESGSDAVLARMERGGKCSVSTHQRAVDLAARHGLACGASFMLGYPGETRGDLQRTFDFIERNRGRLTVEGLYLAVPLPGTELWCWAAERGLVDETMDWQRLTLAYDNPDFDWARFLYLNDEFFPRGEFVEAVIRSGLLPEAVVRRWEWRGKADPAQTRFLRLAEQLARGGLRRIALYGAGEHTRRLCAALGEAAVEVVGVFDDDDDRQGTFLDRYRIDAPSAVAGLRPDAVVISSDAHEDALWAKRDRFESAGVPVFRLYADDAALTAGSPR